MMRRPSVVGVEVPGEGRHGRAAGVVPPEWWGASGRRRAVRTVIKPMMAQLRPPVLLVLPGSHGHAASRVPWPLVLWAATMWWLVWRRTSSKGRPLDMCVCGGGGGGALYGGSRREPSWEPLVTAAPPSGNGGPPGCRRWITAVPVDNCVRFVSTWQWGWCDWWPSLWLTLWLSLWGSCVRREADSSFRTAASQALFTLCPPCRCWRVTLCVAIASGYEEGRKLFSSEGSPVLFGLDVPHRTRAASAYVGVASRWKRAPTDIQSHRKNTCCLEFGWCLLWPVYIHCLDGEWRRRLWHVGEDPHRLFG